MLAALAVAAAAVLPLGVWPTTSGPAATVVRDVEFYVTEPEDDYTILAVQALDPPLKGSDPAAVSRLAETAIRLGADAVVLLEAMPEAAIPKDVDTPLVGDGRAGAAAYVVFTAPDDLPGTDDAPRWAASKGHRRHDRRPPSGRPAVPLPSR